MSRQPLVVAQYGLSQSRHFRVAASRRWAWWSMVLESLHGADGVRLLALLIESVVIRVVAVDFAQAKIAPGVYRIRARATPGRTQLRRLLRLRARPPTRGTAANEGRKLHVHRAGSWRITYQEPAYPMCVHWAGRGLRPLDPRNGDTAALRRLRPRRRCGRQAAARLLRWRSGPCRVTAAADRAGSSCGPAGRLARSRLQEPPRRGSRSDVAEHRHGDVRRQLTDRVGVNDRFTWGRPRMGRPCGSSASW